MGHDNLGRIERRRSHAESVQSVIAFNKVPPEHR